MSKTQDYIDRYAEYAMEQMERYGIPASITLAQGLLESANGQSRLARQENNHFGIKATKDWLDNGGKYGVYTDDRPNEKFCSYQSVRDSFEHHSRFIVNNTRYNGCLSLPVNDYRGWAEGLQKAGYATSKLYSKSLISIIESNDLQKYDKMVIDSPGRYATDYKPNLPDRKDGGNTRGLNRSNVAQENDLASKRDTGQSQSQNQSHDVSAQNQSQDKVQTLNLTEENQEEDFQSWMRKLYTGEDDQDKSQSSSMDPITEMVITMFTSLFAIAAMIDNKTPLEQSSEARRAVNDQEIDLMPLLRDQSSKGGTDEMNNEMNAGAVKSNLNGVLNINPSSSINPLQRTAQNEERTSEQTNQTLPTGLKVEDIRSCKFQVTEQAKATIVIEDNQGHTHCYGVSAKELSNLQSALNAPRMSTQQKTMAVVSFIGTSMAKSMDRENRQQASNDKALDRANNSSKTNTTVTTVTQTQTTPTLNIAQVSNPAPTITVSTAAQISSRNYDLAENESRSREGQSYRL